ncbi:MAG: hypothetical protein WC179_09755 [Candidatus Cloacimonadaceae bacterium]
MKKDVTSAGDTNMGHYIDEAITEAVESKDLSWDKENKVVCIDWDTKKVYEATITFREITDKEEIAKYYDL